jgi:hypothetical protein
MVLVAALAFAIVAASSFAVPVFAPGKPSTTPPLHTLCHSAGTGDAISACVRAAVPPS